jgi:hypothetical protein
VRELELTHLGGHVRSGDHAHEHEMWSHGADRAGRHRSRLGILRKPDEPIQQGTELVRPSKLARRGRHRSLGRVKSLLLEVSASGRLNTPVPVESTLLSNEEAARTDRQLCETSRSCCCAAVAHGPNAPPPVPATDATPALSCGYVCSPDGIRTRATALRVPSQRI